MDDFRSGGLRGRTRIAGEDLTVCGLRSLVDRASLDSEDFAGAARLWILTSGLYSGTRSTSCRTVLVVTCRMIPLHK